jgi:hypothetical protein
MKLAIYLLAQGSENQSNLRKVTSFSLKPDGVKHEPGKPAETANYRNSLVKFIELDCGHRSNCPVWALVDRS